MCLRTLQDIEAAGSLLVVWNTTTRSARFLTAVDGMGFSRHDHLVSPSEIIKVLYKHHWEANYIISGRVRIVDRIPAKNG